MDAIRTVLELLRERLNAFLQTAEPRSDDWVVLSNIVGHDGRAVEAAKNKVVITLAQLTANAMDRNLPRTAGGATQPPPRHDLLIVFFANFENERYADGLSAIGRTIGFFHQNPVFTPGPPGLGPGFEHFAMAEDNLDLADLRNLMDMLGTRYLPTATYRLRMIPAAAGNAAQK